MSNDLSSIGWQPLVLSDGRTLEPMGLRTTPEGNAPWVWSAEDTLTVGAGPRTLTDQRLHLSFFHREHRPTEVEMRMIMEALGLAGRSVVAETGVEISPNIVSVLLSDD